MNEHSFEWVLARCLDRIAAGEAAAACLADHPEHANSLAPLLAAAVQVGALRTFRIDSASRQSMRAQILQAEIARNQREPASRWRWLYPAASRPRLGTGLIIALLCFVMSAAAVAASQPGDLAYGVRVAAERVAALLVREPGNRVRAELGIVERRLADLDRTAHRQALDERSVSALLNSVDDAVALALRLSDAERAQVAARLREQAQHLARLGAIARSDGGESALQGAAFRVRLASERVWPPAPQPDPSSPLGPATATPGVGATQSPTPTALGEVEPTRGSVASLTPRPAKTPVPGGPVRSATASAPGPDGTPQGPRPGATLQGPRASATAPGPRPTGTPQPPGPNATRQGPGPSATPQGPGPNSTPQAPGPSATPQGPGPNATPQGPGPSATPQGPGPNATPQGPGPSATPQGPGTGATPQAPDPTSTPRGPAPGPTLPQPGPSSTARPQP